MKRLYGFSAIVLFASAAMAQGVTSISAPPSTVDVPPVAISKTQSCADAYPADARAAHTEGTTDVLYTVSADGSVTKAVVVAASGSASFEAPALACVSGWRFKPATSKGKPVALGREAEIVWRMPDNLPPGEYIPPATLDLLDRGATLAAATGSPHVCNIIPGAWRWKAGPMLTFRIAADGSVTNAKVLYASPDSATDKAALACAMAWKYTPAMLGGKPVAVDWQNNVSWIDPRISPPKPGEPPDPLTNTITVQSRASTPPPISMPASIGKPHACMQVFPALSMRLGEQGTTSLRFTITDQGTVANVEVEGTSGHARLDQAAIQCTNGWLYKPAVKDGTPVAVPWKSMVKWSLSGGPNRSCTAFDPAAARNAHAEGTTDLTLVVDKDGLPKDILVTRSTGSKVLDGAAVACAGSWRYSPPIVDGEPVELPMQASVNWLAK